MTLTRTGVARAVVTPLVAAAVGWHALASFVWVAPQTPLEDSAGPVLTSYFTPLFHQAWTVFAPEPLSGDVTVMAAYSDGRAVDLTETLRNEGLHHVVPPRSWRMVEAFGRDFIDAHAGLDQTANAAVAQDVTDASNALPDFGDYSIREAALVRLASTYRCGASAPPAGTLVKIHVTFHEVRPYGQVQAPPPVDSVMTGWRPVVPVSDTECASAPWPR